MEFSLLAAAAIGVGALWATLWWEGPRGNAVECDGDLFEMALTAAITGLAVGRVWAMVAAGTNPLTAPGDLLIIRGGVATGPAALGALVMFGWLARRQPWWLADGMAAAAIAGLAGWHAGCLARTGSCLGTPSDLPWAMTGPGSTIGRHPVEIYAALALAAVAVALAILKVSDRRPAPGTLAGVALAAAAAIRLVTEPLRPSLGSGPIAWYAAGIALGLGVAVWRARASRPAAISAP